MNYKLINKTTNEETICTKVVVDGFDYYIAHGLKKYKDYFYVSLGDTIEQYEESVDYGNFHPDSIGWKKIIATNNPSIDVPKVLDEVKELAVKIVYTTGIIPTSNIYGQFVGFQNGYNKSQETHPYSEEDMIEFTEWCSINFWVYDSNNKIWENSFERGDEFSKTTKELLEIWKEQKTKTIYYEL
jgi:hypothetical protein